MSKGEFIYGLERCCDIMFAMRFLPKLGCCAGSSENPKEAGTAGAMTEVSGPTGASNEAEESNMLKTVGWISAALGEVALGLLVGRELRLRYKFNRRTPYDLYSHSGDELPDVDFGVGI
jgi:hypothetical protein